MRYGAMGGGRLCQPGKRYRSARWGETSDFPLAHAENVALCYICSATVTAAP